MEEVAVRSIDIARTEATTLTRHREQPPRPVRGAGVRFFRRHHGRRLHLRRGPAPQRVHPASVARTVGPFTAGELAGGLHRCSVPRWPPAST